MACLTAVLLALLAPSTNSPLHAQTAAGAQRRIVVVVSTSNPVASLRPVEARRIFLREQRLWPNGTAISVFERPTDQPIRGQFASLVLGRTQNQMAQYWLNLALTQGMDPPTISRTPQLLNHYLERTKGGIGYVYEDEIQSDMKIVARVDREAR